MNKKFSTRFFIMLTVVALLVGCFPAYAAPSSEPQEFSLTDDYAFEYSNASSVENGMVFMGAGSILYDYFMPFDSDSISIKYTADNPVTLNIETDNGTYTAELLETATEAKVAVTELCGSTILKLTSSGAVTINQMIFNKIDEFYNDVTKYSVKISEYDEAILTSIIVGVNSSVIRVKGATRFLDIANRNLTPMNHNGSLYVPAKVLAEAMSLYCEDYPDKSYLYFAGKEEEIILIGGVGEKRFNDSPAKPFSMNVLYADGKAWVPFRALAEAFGLTVTYRDGIAVADDRHHAANVIENEEIFSVLSEEMSKFVPVSSAGRVYHVAKTQTASDANSGTEAYPFATIQRAADVVAAGDTVIIHEGVYRETVVPKNSGTPMAPIKFIAAEGENVTVSALEKVDTFLPFKNNIYCATVPVNLGIGKNQVFYKGKGITEGRHPNTDTQTNVLPFPEDFPEEYWPTKGDIYVREYESDIAKSANDLNQTEPDYWKGGIYVGLKGLAWNMVSGDIVGSSYGELKLRNHDGVLSYALGIGSTYYKEAYEGEDYGYITNHLNTVDSPGEWYIGGNMLYFYPPEGADLDKDTVEVKQRQLTFDLREKKNIVVEGINTIGGSITMAGDTEFNVINGGHHEYISHFTKIMDGQSGYELSRNEPNAPQRGEVGFFMDGINNSIVNTRIDFSAGAGVYTVGQHSYIHNNTMYNAGYGGLYVGGITVEFQRWDAVDAKRGGDTITHNTVANAGRGCFHTHGNQNNTARTWLPSEVAYNRFYNGAATSRDTGIYYQYGMRSGLDRSRMLVHHNMVYNPIHWDEHGKLIIYSLYHDGNTKGVTTYNNLTFYEHEDRPHYQGLLVQNFSTAMSDARTTANLDLGLYTNGVENLKPQNFPAGKPFYAGSYNDGRERLMLNYDSYVNKDAGAYYPVKNADNAHTFENVKIKGDTVNRLTFYFTTDVGFGDIFYVDCEVKGEETYTVRLPLKLTNNAQHNTFFNRKEEAGFIFLPDMKEGNYTVTLKPTSEKVDIFRMRSDESDDSYVFPEERNCILAATYDDAIVNPLNESAPPKITVASSLTRVKKHTNYGISQTWNHTVIYKDREINTDANHISINYGTHGEWSGGKCIIRVDSPDAEPICEVVLDGDMWIKHDKTVPLNSVLPKGKHTFYVTFEGEGKTTDFMNFAFMNIQDTENE